MMENTENESTDTKCIKKEWGSYKVLDEGPGYKVKRIAILPERSIELHYHKKRHEDCIIIIGKLTVQFQNDTIYNCNDRSFSIPKDTIHSVKNSGKTIAVFIVIEKGECREEEDIFFT